MGSKLPVDISDFVIKFYKPFIHKFNKLSDNKYVQIESLKEKVTPDYSLFMKYYSYNDILCASIKFLILKQEDYYKKIIEMLSIEDEIQLNHLKIKIMPSGKKRKRHKIATHKRKKRLRKNRHKKK